MPALPPPLPDEKKLRAANVLNWLLPGSGLFYLGQRLVGGVLAGAFLACFFAVLAVFITGYLRYFWIATNTNLMEGDNLEQAVGAFHQPWLLGLAGFGLFLYVISAVLFARAKRRFVRERQRP
jgi:hypothetical protein